MNFTKKTILLPAVLLSAFFCCSAGLAVSAATTDTAETELTAANTFSDVEPDDWFYEDVTTLTGLGILNGYPDGLFHPEREITTAEFIKVLLCTDPESTFEPIVPDSSPYSGHWASVYIAEALHRGILTENELATGFDPDAPISRSDMTKMMIRALGIEPARIDDPFSDISDMYASTAYNEYLLRGYPTADGSRTYNGSASALRSEAAAIAVRVIEYREDSYAYKRDAILSNAEENILTTESELIDLFYILNREFITEFTFETPIPISIWQQYYQHSNIIFVEYFYSSSVSINYVKGGTEYTIILQYDRDIDELKALHAKADEKADAILDSIITDSMSDYDKVKAIHDYIILNCEYDFDNYLLGTIPSESRMSYGVLCEHKAVCQGYTAAFNLLCGKAGIRSIAIGGYAPNSSEDHSWNMVLIGGQIYYVDTTHDDPVPDRKGRTSYKYFYLTEAEMTSLGYAWDKTQSNIKYFY